MSTAGHSVSDTSATQQGTATTPSGTATPSGYGNATTAYGYVPRRPKKEKPYGPSFTTMMNRTWRGPGRKYLKYAFASFWASFIMLTCALVYLIKRNNGRVIVKRRDVFGAIFTILFLCFLSLMFHYIYKARMASNHWRMFIRFRAVGLRTVQAYNYVYCPEESRATDLATNTFTDKALTIIPFMQERRQFRHRRLRRATTTTKGESEKPPSFHTTWDESHALKDSTYKQPSEIANQSEDQLSTAAPPTGQPTVHGYNLASRPQGVFPPPPPSHFSQNAPSSVGYQSVPYGTQRSMGPQPVPYNAPRMTGHQPVPYNTTRPTGQPPVPYAQRPMGPQPGPYNALRPMGAQPGVYNAPGPTGAQPGMYNAPRPTGAQPGMYNAPRSMGTQPVMYNAPRPTGAQPVMYNAPRPTGSQPVPYGVNTQAAFRPVAHGAPAPPGNQPTIPYGGQMHPVQNSQASQPGYQPRYAPPQPGYQQQRSVELDGQNWPPSYQSRK